MLTPTKKPARIVGIKPQGTAKNSHRARMTRCLPWFNKPWNESAKNVLTLIHMQSEKGSVAMIRRIETRAKRRAQQPGPSGSAERQIKAV